MGERRTVYSDPEAFIPDKEYPEDEYRETLGLVEGEEFTRYIAISTLAGNTLRFAQNRKVEIAVLVDSGGNEWCEPYNEEWHGPTDELVKTRMEEFENNPDFFDAQQSLDQVRKQGSSKPAGFVEDMWRSRGGDPSFKLPKTVYQRNKLR